MTSIVTPHPPAGPDFSQRPMLVFWETTRACRLACRHCRASAQPRPLPGELGTARGHELIDQIAGFGRPLPILVLTGGDCLLRPDLFDLIAHARSAGIHVALSPAVTPLLDGDMIGRIAGSGVSAVSVSLDGARAATHDGVRRIPGHFGATVTALRALAGSGLTVQVNTTVMHANAGELDGVAALLEDVGVHAWEVFFLVETGRGVTAGAVTPDEHEDICHFLYDSARPFVVRTVEAPFFRRVVAQRRAGMPPPADGLYQELAGQLSRRRAGHAPAPGEGTAPARNAAQAGAAQARTAPGRSRAHTAATRDGKGIVFVAHNGDVYPAGFLPLVLGNVRERPLGDIYREHPLLKDIRAARFHGRCGRCPYSDLCGGSRARAYAASGDPLGEDPACPFQPGQDTPPPRRAA